MSQQLLTLTNDLLNRKIPASAFAESFISQWRKERDDGTLLKDNDNLSECLSTIFCLADLYNADEVREEYELNAEQLCQRVHDTLVKHELILTNTHAASTPNVVLTVSSGILPKDLLQPHDEYTI